MTSAPQVVTIHNTGSATLAGFAGGAPADQQFAGSQNCAAGVAPGASCQYTFTFKPTAAGVFSSSSNSASNAGSFAIKLRGEGVGSKHSVSPLELDFGPVTVGGTSAPQVVTVRNVGLATLAGFGGGAPSDPQFGATQNCAAGVAPGGSCQITFTFKPTASGVVNATSSTGSNAGPFTIKLKGSGRPLMLPSVRPGITVSPLELNFGPVGVGTTSATQVVTIRNLSSAALDGFSGADISDPQFETTQNCAGGLAPGATCQYTFTYKPTSTGVVSGTSTTTTNAGPFTIKLNGEGVGPRLHVTPLDLNFGNVPLNTNSTSQVVTVRNVGLAPLSGFTGGTPLNPQFSGLHNCGVVAPGATCQYAYTFKPTVGSVFNTTSSPISNAGSFEIRLRGQNGDVPPSAEITFSPTSITPGGSTRMQVVVRNQNSTTVADDVTYTMSLPPGVTVATTPQASIFGCGTATFTAVAGSSSITLSGGRLTVGTQCQLSVNLRAPEAGTYEISTGEIETSNSGTGSGATASLKVAEPTFDVFLPVIQR